MNRRLFRSTLLVLLTALAAPLLAAPEAWAEAITAFEKADASQPLKPGGVLFIGSSSIRQWTTLADDFPGVPVINRGFGGSELSDSVFYADRIAIPYKPKLIVLYAGENDLWTGKSPESLLKDWKAFHQKIHDALPNTRVMFLSIKESPSRAKIRRAVLRANALIAADCTTDSRCLFADVATPMLDATRKPRPELFQDDQLHLKPAGYALWVKELKPFIHLPIEEP